MKLSPEIIHLEISGVFVWFQLVSTRCFTALTRQKSCRNIAGVLSSYNPLAGIPHVPKIGNEWFGACILVYRLGLLVAQAQRF
jgi:hypothetical protein